MKAHTHTRDFSDGQGTDTESLSELLRLPEGENVHILTSNLLDTTQITERGEKFNKGANQLVHIPGLEGTQWHIPVDLIDRNPEQPRTYFDDESIDTLRANLLGQGQQDDIKVVPVTALGSPTARLLLIDGERRWRAALLAKKLTGADTAYVRGVFRWAPTLRQVFEDGAMSNLHRKQHSPIEEARIFETMIQWRMQQDRMDEDQAIDAVAILTGNTPQKIRNFRILLGLPDEMQEAIGRGKLDSFAALQLAHAGKKYGTHLDLAKAARLVIDNPGKDFIADRGIRRGQVTKAGIQHAVRTTLIQKLELSSATSHGTGRTGWEERKKTREVATQVVGKAASERIVNFATSLGELVKHTRAMTDTAMRPILIKTLRGKEGGVPVEVAIERIMELMPLLEEVHGRVLRVAILPPPMKIPPRNPSFTEQFKQTNIENPKRRVIDRLLAEISENKATRGSILTAAEIAERLQKKGVDIDSKTVASNIRVLNEELAPNRQIIATYTKRVRQGEKAQLDKIDSYRMECIVINSGADERTVNAALQSVIKDEKDDGENGKD